MKKINFILLLLISSLFIHSCSEKVKDGIYLIDIYATNDLHGRLFDTLYTENPQNPQIPQNVAHPYSLSSVATYIRDARLNSERRIVLLDLGDHLQGDNSVFYYNFIDTASNHIFAEVMNYLDYDAVVVGNHDIEAGPRVYNKIIREMKAPYLAANAIDEKRNKPYFKPYTIVTRDGIKIAIIGMTNPNIPKWLSPDLWKGIKFQEIVKSLEYWVEYVKTKENPHLVVAALHAGLGTIEENSLENPARYVASNVSGIDIVFAAHDHRSTAEVVYNGDRPVWVMEGGSRASSLSHASVKIGISDGQIISKNIEGALISMREIEPDKEYNNYFKEHFNNIKAFTNTHVGSLTKSITTRDAYFGSSEYIDMIHTLQLENSGAEISFVAPLSMDVTVKAGDLNFQDLLNIYPYENQLYVIELTGEEIKNYLEFSYSKWVNKMAGNNAPFLQLNIGGRGDRGRFKNIFFNFDSAAGLIYEVDATKGDGERILIISDSNGQPFDFKKRYKVALSSYRASGGGDMLELGAGIPKEELEGRIVERLSDIREMLYNKLKRDGSITPERLNQWKFVPENLVKRAAEKDYKILFGE
jgi:2',3'-cyclic-nucleotide 2'-phosphodiesterase/3'-nucleotidase